MLYKANYTSCWGGYKEDYYVCELCERVTDAYGEEPDWYVGEGKHDMREIPAKPATTEEDGMLLIGSVISAVCRLRILREISW